MTDEEIKKLAEECSLYYQGRPAKRGYELSNRLTIESYALMTLKWLSNDYCIVPKSIVSEKWNDVKTWRFSEYFRGRFQVLKELFGKDMFEEDKI